LIQNRWNKNGNQIITDGQGSIVGKNKEGLVVWQKEYIGGRLEFDQQNTHEYYDNGQLKSEIGYSENKKHGRYSMWYENGQIKAKGTNSYDAPYGYYVEWLEDGKMREEGTWTEDGENLIQNRWNKNGNQIITDGQGSILGKNKEGLVVWQKEYIGGRLEFDQKNEHEYYDNGQLESEIGYSENKKHGRYSMWYENGQIKEKGTNSHDAPYGFQTNWYENGQKRFEGTYKDGELISKKEWNEDGSVKE